MNYLDIISFKQKAFRRFSDSFLPSATTSSAGQSLLTPGNKPEGNSAGEGEPIRAQAPRTPSTWSRFLPDVDEVFDQIREETQPSKRQRGPDDEPDAVDESAFDSLIDEAIDSLWGEQQQPGIDELHALCEAGMQPGGSGSVVMPLAFSTMLVIHARPLVETLRDRQRGGREKRPDPARKDYEYGTTGRSARAWSGPR